MTPARAVLAALAAGAALGALYTAVLWGRVVIPLLARGHRP